MCSRVLVSSGHGSRWSSSVDAVFWKLTYLLEANIAAMHPVSLLALLLLLAIAGVGYLIFSQLHSEIIPKEDYFHRISPPGGQRCSTLKSMLIRS